MALVTCDECKHQVSELAKVCPKCGHPIKSTSWIVSLLNFISWIFGIIFILIGTGSLGSNSNYMIGISVLLMAIILPPIRRYINLKFFKLTFGRLVMVLSILMILAIVNISNSYTPSIKSSTLSKKTDSAPSWSDWELKNAVSKHDAFLVIRQPSDKHCYIKQAYKDVTKMELTYGVGSFYINAAGAFMSGITEPITYRVDNNKHYSTLSDKLSLDILEEMKMGNNLHVEVLPIGTNSIITQSFDLTGFTSALDVLESSECVLLPQKQTSSNMSATIIRDDAQLFVEGTTTLPDNIELFVNLRNVDTGYFDQDQVVVQSGYYRSVGFMDNKKRLPSGTYTVTITSSFMIFQPNDVKRVLGDYGDNIPLDIRNKDGKHSTVRYNVILKIK
jgi:hypothetical protein